jgi:ubiquitin C-terminal hydrolase
MVRDDGTNLKHGKKLKSSSTVRISDCLANYFRTETSDENNLVHCDKCNKKSVAYMRFRIKQLPNILILSVKRNKYDMKTYQL